MLPPLKLSGPKQVKAVTMLCAIALTVSAGLGAYSLTLNMSRFHFAPAVYLSQFAWLFAQCCLAAFFYTLYTRQK